MTLVEPPAESRNTAAALLPKRSRQAETARPRRHALFAACPANATIVQPGRCSIRRAPGTPQFLRH